MRGNVHPSPGSIFPCSVCTENVTWQGKSVQCCTCSKWVHLRCSQLSLSKFRTLDGSHSWSCPPCCVPTRNTVTPSSDSSDTYASTVQSIRLSTNAALPSHLRLQTSYPPLAHSVSSPSAPSPPSLAPGCPSTPPVFSPPITLSGFFKKMLEVFEPGALNYFTFSRPILLTLSASRNPILTHFSFQILGFYALRSDRTHSRSGIFSPDATHASGGVIIFVRQGLSFSELSTSSLSSLDPYSDYVRINFSLNNYYSVSFFNVYVPPIRPSPTHGRTDFFSSSILPSSRHLFILGDFNCHHPLWDSKGTSDPHKEVIFDWFISSDHLPLNDPDTSTFLNRSAGSRSSPDISFAPSSLGIPCCCEVLQDLGSDHLPILLSVPLSPVFCPNERPPFLQFPESSLGRLCLLLSLCRGILVSFSFLC